MAEPKVAFVADRPREHLAAVREEAETASDQPGAVAPREALAA